MRERESSIFFKTQRAAHAVGVQTDFCNEDAGKSF